MNCACGGCFSHSTTEKMCTMQQTEANGKSCGKRFATQNQVWQAPGGAFEPHATPPGQMQTQDEPKDHWAALCVRMALPGKFFMPQGVRHTHMESRSRQSCSYHIDDALAAANAQRLPHEAAGGARCSFLFCFCCCCIPVALNKNIANVYYSHAKRNHRNKIIE